MAIIGEMKFLERLQFFNGQRLFASDLQSLEAFNRDMRWLHNQSLHQPGVASGYAVAGGKGDREVTITPGYALDSLGREIVLTESRLEPVPPVADNGADRPALYDLAVAYPDDTDLKETEKREGICLPRGVIRLREEPVFCWVALGDDGQPRDEQLKTRIQNGLLIVLARAEILNCQLNQPLSTAQRRSARPPKQPRIVCGRTKAVWVATPLDPGAKLRFNVLLDLTLVPVKFAARVDTSAARFAATPCYSARLAGERVRTSPITTGPSGDFTWVVDALVNIATSPSPTATEFTLEAFPLVQSYAVSADPVAINKDLFDGWEVCWLGVEG